MVSVVIATFNGENYIKEQLNSICQQNCLPDEVVIIDDCSLDNTYSIIEHFVEKHKELKWNIYKNEKNMGYIKTFFKAIDYAQGDIIILCDQDDLWSYNKVNHIVKLFQENKNILSLHENYHIVDSDGHLMKKSALNYRKPLKKCSLYRFCKKLNYCGMSSSFRSSLKPYIKLIEHYHLPTHDWVIHAIAACKNGMYVSSNVSSFRRFHGNNVALNLEKAERRGIEQRKSIVGEYLNYYMLLKLISLKLGNYGGINKKIINRYIRTCKIRLNYLKDKDLLTYIKSFRLIKYFQSIKAFVCDFIYLIGVY